MKMCNFKSSLWIVLFITILPYVTQAHTKGISCFKCLVTALRPEEEELLCPRFDGSAKFQTFCPTSTLCMKRTIKYKSSSVVLRDCTPQKNVFHAYNKDAKQWDKKEEVITTAYDEGCFIGEHRGAPTDPPEYCFCSFHLCNLSPKEIGIFGKIYGTILVILIMRFL